MTLPCLSVRLDWLTLMSRPDNDAADCVVGDGLIRSGRVVERIRFGDGQWPKFPGLEVGCHLLKAPRRVDDTELGAVRAEDTNFVVVQVEQIDVDCAGADGADDHQPAPQGEGGQRGRSGHPADSVVDHLYACAAGQLLDLRADVGGGVEDHEVINDGRGGGLRAGPATVYANHLGAERMGDLRHSPAHATGDAEDRNGFTSHQLCSFHRAVPSDDKVDPDGGGFV